MLLHLLYALQMEPCFHQLANTFKPLYGEQTLRNWKWIATMHRNGYTVLLSLIFNCLYVKQPYKGYSLWKQWGGLRQRTFHGFKNNTWVLSAAIHQRVASDNTALGV